MPIHDWTRVNAGLFHHFHHGWIAALSDHFNARGGLPTGYYALIERVRNRPSVDAITEREQYAAKANRISIRHPLGSVVPVVEIVSPGNKANSRALRTFIDKVVEFFRQGIHLLIVDLHPPTAYDPHGVHKAIWDEINDKPFDFRLEKSLTLVSYEAVTPGAAYVEPLAVGDAIPDMPLFLTDGVYVPVSLEATYESAWAACPKPLKELLEGSSESST